MDLSSMEPNNYYNDLPNDIYMEVPSALASTGGVIGLFDDGTIIDAGDDDILTHDQDTERPYLLCSNDSINYTLSSVFCNRSYSFPNYGQNDYKENFELERIVSVVVPILFGIIFIVGLFGNALVVMVVASNQQMRNTTNYLILNLAIADLLFIIFCVPFTATDYVLSYWPFGETWCKMVQYLIIVTAYASVSTLVLMSLDRFLAVVFPVASISLRTEKNTLLAISITWVAILAACFPAFMAHGLETHSYAYEEAEVCTFRQNFNHVAFQLIFMLTSYAIPLAIIILLYFGMLLRLWKSSLATSTNQNALRGKKRVTRMIVVVVGVFAICWLPIQVVLVLKSLNLYEITDVTIGIQITAHVLGYMNSCINPILYAFLSDNFRKGFRKVIQCKISFSRVRNGNVWGGSRMRSGRTAVGDGGEEGNGNGNGNGGIGGGRRGGRGGSRNHVERNCNTGTTGLTGNDMHLNPLMVKETTLLTTHCENGGGNSHHFIQAKSKKSGRYSDFGEESDIL